MTRSEWKKLTDERHLLVTVKRPEITEKLREARSLGDLSENAAYLEARREQRELEARITEIDRILDSLEEIIQ